MGWVKDCCGMRRKKELFESSEINTMVILYVESRNKELFIRVYVNAPIVNYILYFLYLRIRY